MFPEDPETAETLAGGPLPLHEDHGTDPLISVEDVAALEEPTRRASAADLPSLLGGSEQTVTRTQRGDEGVLEATVVRRVPSELAATHAGRPAEPTWAPPSDPVPPEHEAGGDTVALEETSRPQLRVIPGGRSESPGPPRTRTRPAASAPPSTQSAATRRRSRQPALPPETRVGEGPDGPEEAGSPPDVRWRWWLIGVLSATAWLTVAGALGWWVADLEIQAHDEPVLAP